MTHPPVRRSSSSAPRSRLRARRWAPLVLAVTTALALLGASTAGAAQAPVGLGTATSFAVLAGAGITNTGATTITGDVGTFPTTSETGFGTIVQTGVDHAGDAVTQQAKLDLVDAYDDAAGRGPVTAAVPVDLAGQVLTPGVYSSGTLELSGALTLDAQGDPNAVFVFQAASTLVTASASTVTVVNGGATTACNIVWKVGSSATLGSGSDFVGTVLAQESISLDSTAVVEGRLLARTGEVTLINNTITNTGCTALPTTPPTSATPTTTPGDGAGGGTTGGSGGGVTTTVPGGGTTTGLDRSLAFTGTDPRIAVLGGSLLLAGAALMVVGRGRRFAR
jgi:hypothetical protein